MSVRVRFAPSPTGWLHVGGARTAYFNWLYARKHGGQFVIRIEDTDVQRSTPEAEGGVLDDLRWLGLDADEGPEQGGPYGPYRQSERQAIYRERAELLVSQGLAYPCFCTDAELEARRARALAGGRPPHYDGRCRAFSAPERLALRSEGRPESLRFIVADRDWVVDDEVRGEVRFPAGMVGDFVILRASGLPTYNFAAAVDDAAMKITHVIRAEEHLANTPRQLMIYEALRETPPRFAHVPLILNRDRTKMSKREGEAAVGVGEWRRAGYLSEALLSYLALLGFHPGDDREILSRAELIEAFTLDRVGKSGSVFDPDKLRWVNAHYLHHASGSELALWGREFLPPAVAGLAEPGLAKLLEVVRGNIETLAGLTAALEPFLGGALEFEDEARLALDTESGRAACAAMASELEALAEWNAERFKSALQAVGKRLGLKGRELFQPVRAALTGRVHGPELPMVAEWIGRARCVERLIEAAGARREP